MKLVSGVTKGSEANDSIPVDTLSMDSIQLAIYRHNKAVDDSLAQDSINKKRKNGIDSPVEYSAEDSLTYEAATGLAHLYGGSKVKYHLAHCGLFSSCCTYCCGAQHG